MVANIKQPAGDAPYLWRIKKAKERVLDTKPSVDIENALILTESFLKTEGETLVVRKAKGFREQCQRKTIFIQERNINDYRQAELSRLIGYVPQGGGGQNLPYTVHDFVSMGRYPYLKPFSAPSPRDRSAVDEALSQTSTAHLKGRYLFELSGGEQQKVQLAAALAQSPEILLLDEPGAYLDPGWNAEIHRVLRRVNRKQGVTLVSVTHDLNSAISMSGRILALKEGRIHYFAESSRFADARILKELFNHPFTVLDHPKLGKKVLPEVAE